MIEELFSELSKYPEVEAIALGGSRAGSCYDKTSDYDVYVYCTGIIPEENRKKLLSRFCKVMEIGNHFWEYEDNCTLNNQIDLDIIYRNLDEFLVDISHVVFDYQSHNGYTTCMWHNVINCKIVYDRDGRLQAAQNQFSVEYPIQLKNNIIEHNMKLLKTALPAYRNQIKKAVDRGDLVSINHRVTEFMASYFDIIFALNQLTHPGEKRLVELCIESCRILPKHFQENIMFLFQDMFTVPEKIGSDLDRLLENLGKVL